MNLSDITKINFGSAGISAVYNGGIKLWPQGSELSNKVMKFTTTDGNTWNHTYISAYTADNRLIQPVKKMLRDGPMTRRLDILEVWEVCGVMEQIF